MTLQVVTAEGTDITTLLPDGVDIRVVMDVEGSAPIWSTATVPDDVITFATLVDVMLLEGGTIEPVEPEVPEA